MRMDHIAERLPRDMNGRQLPPFGFLPLSVHCIKVTLVRFPISGDVMGPSNLP